MLKNRRREKAGNDSRMCRYVPLCAVMCRYVRCRRRPYCGVTCAVAATAYRQAVAAKIVSLCFLLIKLTDHSRADAQ